MKNFSLIGSDIDFSLSAVMMNHAFKDAGIKAFYQLMPLNDLVDFKSKIQNLAGFNVTRPFKSQIASMCTFLSQEAQITGSVNTVIVNKNEQDFLLSGYNTDITGFLLTLNKYFPSLKNSNALILGSGGSARSIVYAFLNNGCKKIDILCRSIESATRIKMDFAAFFDADKIDIVSLHSVETQKKRIASADFFVNCTPVGMNGKLENTDIFFMHNLKKTCFVFDLVYTPLDTLFVKKARSLSLSGCSGLEMLVYQGKEAFKLWTGKEFDAENMITLLEKCIK